MQLTAEQEGALAEFDLFVRTEVIPHAERWDQDECLPADVIQSVAARGYFGAVIPPEYDGMGMDAVTFGLLNEAIAYGCSSLRSVLTVHSMVSHAIVRWGTAKQRSEWLPRLAAGTAVGAFALTEPDVGSDAAGLRTTAQPQEDQYLLSGRKRWITYGQAADVFLVFARAATGISAFLVGRHSKGLVIVPMSGLLGTRAALLAELELGECPIPASTLVGRIGFGLSAVATSALEIGRYSVAWGCVGLGQACLDASIRYANEREQFGKRLVDHQLIQQLIADMATNLSAARLLCHQAGLLKAAGDPGAVPATWKAKYFASRCAFKAAADAVQIHGANGCGNAYPVQRLLRDAKIMEVIEGSTQIQQLMIARAACDGLRSRPVLAQRRGGMHAEGNGL